MVSAIRTIGHEDRLSLVEHLDELRSRLILSGIALAIAFGFCLWQNHALLKVINHPLKAQTQKQVARGEGTVGQAVVAQQALLKLASHTRSALGVLEKPGSGLSSSARAELQPLLGTLQRDVAKVPRSPQGDNPATLGVGEPFTTTITVTFYFALIIALPFILLELYGFIGPALHPRERRAAMPLLCSVPFLFVGGVLFGYFVVLPAAVRFFVNFNSGEFNVIVQASQYYSFAATILLAMGLVFQVPVLVVGATRLGLVTPRQLRKYRRYAVIVCAAVAAFLPGDVITLILETVPLYLLYEVSILVAALVGRSSGVPRNQGSASETDARHPADAPAFAPEHTAEPTVQEIIDHVDPKLSD
jgi:sec-independent protein translocase protein TatC